MKVINLMAGPGSGKSTTAAGLFNIMKLRGHNVELITEFAKDLTWEGRINTLSNQLYILAKQEARQSRLEGKVDWVITDSPLVLGLVYVNERFNTDWFRRATVGAFSLYKNISFFIERVKPYSQVGRNQNLNEAKLIDWAVKDMMTYQGLSYIPIPGDENASKAIYNILFPKEQI